MKTIANFNPLPLFFLPFLFVFFIWSVIALFVIGGTIFWIWMLVDLLKRDFPAAKENEKIIWVLVLVFTYWLGALIYYFMVKKKDKKI
ncbi:MAG: PLDc N-terminal domain-containing protein [Candidatus Doudnabacteria bacterium]